MPACSRCGEEYCKAKHSALLEKEREFISLYHVMTEGICSDCILEEIEGIKSCSGDHGPMHPNETAEEFHSHEDPEK